MDRKSESFSRLFRFPEPGFLMKIKLGSLVFCLGTGKKVTHSPICMTEEIHP
jgi:hypothetical protein